MVVATAAESTWRGESDLLLVRYFDMMGDPIDGEPMVTVEDMRGATFFADYAKADDHRMWVLEANKPDDAKQWQRARAHRETEARHARYQADPYGAVANVNETANAYNERKVKGRT